MKTEPLIRDANFDDQEELKVIARLYAEVPLDWDTNFPAKQEEDINYRWLQEKRSSIKCLLVILDSEIIGVHILQMQSQRPEACFIKTLWVAPSYRGQGLGSKLKSAGEAWARNIGVKTIVTHVMVKNPKMLEINKKKGFVPTKIELEKSLV